MEQKPDRVPLIVSLAYCSLTLFSPGLFLVYAFHPHFARYEDTVRYNPVFTTILVSLVLLGVALFVWASRVKAARWLLVPATLVNGLFLWWFWSGTQYMNFLTGR